MARLVALDLAHEAARLVHLLCDQMPRVHHDLADQARRSANSAVLNLSEGAGRRGRSRRYHYEVSYASAGECFDTMVLARDVGAVRPDHAETCDRALAALDRTRRMEWGLMRPWR